MNIQSATSRATLLGRRPSVQVNFGGRRKIGFLSDEEQQKMNAFVDSIREPRYEGKSLLGFAKHLSEVRPIHSNQGWAGLAKKVSESFGITA